MGSTEYDGLQSRWCLAGCGGGRRRGLDNDFVDHIGVRVIVIITFCSEEDSGSTRVL